MARERARGRVLLRAAALVPVKVSVLVLALVPVRWAAPTPDLGWALEVEPQFQAARSCRVEP